jgi:hypothetical protein
LSVTYQVTEWFWAYLTRFSFAAVFRRQPHHSGSSRMAYQRLQNCTALSSSGNFGMPHSTFGMVTFCQWQLCQEWSWSIYSYCSDSCGIDVYKKDAWSSDRLSADSTLPIISNHHGVVEGNMPEASILLL